MIFRCRCRGRCHCGRGRWTAGTWIAFGLLLLAGAGVSVRLLAWVIWILLAVGVIVWLARHWPRPVVKIYRSPSVGPAPERLDDTLPLNPRLYRSDRR